MKILKKFLILAMIPIAILIALIYISKNNVSAASTSCKGTPIKVGVFLDNINTTFNSFLKQNLEIIEKSNPNEIKFSFFDANDNQSVQNESIDKSLAQKFDIFIINLVSPNLNDVENTLNKIMERNIPMILSPDPSQNIIDFVSSYKKFVIIGADFKQSGTMEGTILVNEWNSNKELIDKNHDNILQYVMLKGRIGSPLTDLRTKYSILALNEAGIKTDEIASDNCEWLQDCAKNSIESLFLRYGNKIEAIIANNDAMAIGSVEALQRYGYNSGDKDRTIPVVGIDGLPTAKDLIQKGFMTGTVILDPHDIAEAFYTIGMNLACGKYPLENTNYKFDDTGFTVHLTYKEYTK